MPNLLIIIDLCVIVFYVDDLCAGYEIITCSMIGV